MYIRTTELSFVHSRVYVYARRARSREVILNSFILRELTVRKIGNGSANIITPVVLGRATPSFSVISSVFKNTSPSPQSAATRGRRTPFRRFRARVHIVISASRANIKVWRSACVLGLSRLAFRTWTFFMWLRCVHLCRRL